MITLIVLMLAQAPSQAPPKLALERWQVDARFSTVGFDAESTMHDFTGKTHAITGELRFDPGAVATCAGGAVWIETRTLDTDNSSRDEDMQKTFDVATYPEIVFTLDTVDGQLADGRGDLVGHGRFNVKGVEVKRDFRFKIEPAEGGTLHVTGDAKLSLKEHELKPPRVLFIKVKDDVRVWFDLRLAKVPEELVNATQRTIDLRRNVLGGVPNDFPELLVLMANGSSQYRLWLTEHGVLFEGIGGRAWGLLVGDKLTAMDPRSAKTRVLDPTVETHVKLTKSSTTTDPVLIETEHISLKAAGLSGTERVAALLIAAGIAPENLLPAYWAVRGVPDTLDYSVHVQYGEIDASIIDASMAGAARRDAQIPAWALHPDSWLRAPQVAAPPPKKKAERARDADDH